MGLKLKPKIKRKFKALGRKRANIVDKVAKGILNVRPVNTI